MKHLSTKAIMHCESVNKASFLVFIQFTAYRIENLKPKVYTSASQTLVTINVEMLLFLAYIL